ncbi:Protein unc-80 -like protein [Collichthys lucidus]|uniref:Protein unc-80-like protein n=1 Tax=Collichthys lucidus TaxID=240159 RepID=A0A4V6ALM5_COLLU|nr:Protein unc-80 -like protein [Collichthys lucidus]
MPLDKGLLFKSVNLCDPERLCNWLKRSSLSGLTDGVEDLLDISSVDRLSFIRQSSKVKFTSAVKLSESGAVGPEYARDEEENFFKRLGKWRSGRRNPSKLHHTEEKDGRPPRPWGAHPRPPPIVLSLFLSPASCLSVWCRVLSRKVVVFFRPPFSMSAPPDSCLLHSRSSFLHLTVERRKRVGINHIYETIFLPQSCAISSMTEAVGALFVSFVVTSGGPHGFQERLAASQEAMKNKNVVNLGAIRQGMKRFQFLLNCCEPGTIPDASILAAALDLEAPVVARASLFLECARFVHRCNRGNWPEWMKGHHVNITKRGLSRGRSPIVGNKRNQKLQWNAAKYFCQWGDAIGTRLSELCHSDSESPANILGYIFDEETKRRMRKEDEEEDYLDDNTVNPTKCGCPFALKMAACQLLLEITTFLRETFPCLPRPRTEPLVDLDSCRLRLDPELGRHRYERKISAMIEILPIQHFTVFLMTALEHDINKSFSARAVSRSHQRAEHILKNLQQEEEKRRLGREASIITAIPVAQEACYEPTCSPPPEQEEEAEEVVNLASRRLSVSPSCASSNSHRNYSFRRGSVWSVRSLASAEDEENTTEHTPTHHMLQPPQAVFPACICAAVLPIVHLMEDGEVREDGVAVSAVAQQILWNCLIEDPALVLRHFLEKLTVSNRQDELMYMLRKLLLNIGDLPAQTLHILFNYLVGLIMYFVRTPCEWGMDAISATLTFLWEVVGYVEGLFFKDLKQTMKKEQCEVKLLVTASVPGTKTLVVHGQNECDIPTQLPECLEFFNIPEARSAHYFLMDKRWNLIHYSKTYVRDIYPFRRSVSPQLNLVHMLPEKGQELIQKQVFSRKLEEVGRVLFLISLTQHMPAVHKQSHVSLLQEDLLRLPSFPRTAIDAEFSLFNEQQGKELFGLDTLHKVLWIKLLEEMFLGMPSEYPWGDEMMLFLNVFNGALLLHPEDSSLLRQYTATAINTAVHFNHLFSLSGYQWILPTMLQVYADYESDPLLRQGIEFCCRQFYILHRKPFILQLFASVAPLLEFTTSTSTGLSKGVSAQCLFDLLVSLEGETQDALDALELVKAEKPLRSLDFCYDNEDLTFSISEAIKLCVTVVAYAPESFRSLQMLMVLEALVPCHLQKLKSNTVTMESASAARDEIAAIAALATSLQALLYSSEALTRPMTAPQMSRCDQGHKGGTTANHAMSGGVNTRDNLHLLEEGQGMPREELDKRIAREEFRRPRESLLNICTEFYKHCGPRLKVLQNVAGEPRVTALELLDIKSHMRLAEIAHALLKLAPYDTLTMESRGLRRYIMEMLPITDWSSEAVRPALILILKRLDRMFNKIHKMPTLRRQVEWEAASSLIEGICLTLQRQPIISFLPHLRSLINVCVNLVMGVVGPSSVADGLPLLHLSPYLSPPLPFSTVVVRLVALQIQALKENFPLSHVISPFTNQERREGMLLNLLIPFVLTVGSGSKDSPHLEQPEIFLLLQTVINILLPPRIISTSRTKNFMLDASPAHCSTPGDTGKDLRREGLAESTSQAAYLALKVVLVCFERSLGNQWYRLSLQVKEMALRKVGGLAFWDFIDFIVRTRIPIFVLLRPFIQCKLLTQPADSQEEITARHHIADQLERRFIPRPLCKSSLFAEFNNELKILKEAVHSGSAYQGKTSISTVGTSTSAYRLSLATMSRSNTGTGTVWEQDSQPSRQPSQDTLSRTDEDDEENDSMSIPSVVIEHEAFLPRVIAQRRFSSHATGSAASQPEAPRTTMLPSHSEPNVLDESQGLLQEGNLSRVASVQSEPGQQNLLIQPPLGRKRGLRQLRRPLLSIPKNEPRGRSGARLSMTRRSIQPKNKPLAHGDQKRSVTFTENQGQQPSTPGAMEPAAEARKASPALSKSPTLEVPSASSATVTADLHGPANCTVSQLNLQDLKCVVTQVPPAISSKDKREQWGLRSSLSPPPSISRPSTPTPPSRTCSPLPLSRTCSPLPLSRTSSPLPPPLPVLGTAPAPGPPPPPPLPPLLPPPPPGPPRIRESPGDEDTTALLPRSDTLLQLSEDDGTENPPLTPLLSPPSPRHTPRRSPRRLPLPLSPVDLDLDESHV